MSQPLPTGGFRWVEVRKDWNPKDIVNKLIVSYPKELHDYHNDLPFMCEKMKVGGVEKLVPNLYYKMKYVIRIKALAQAIEH